MAEIARLRVEIDEVTPAVIRRVEVPLTIRLDDLHFVLQIAIGWQNCHPFEFRAGDTAWGLLDRDNPDASPLAAETATLADLLARGIGIRFKGVEKTNVEEYCVSEGWIRVAAGTAKDRFGNPLTIKLNGPVEPYFQDKKEG